MRQRRTERQLHILAFILGVLIAGQSVLAQTGGSGPDRGFSPGKSYSISDIETIAQQSGNLMLNMPLGSLPAGRGGISAGVGLHYNSKLWDKLTTAAAPEDPKYTDLLVASKDGGWRYQYGYRVDVEYKPTVCDTQEQWGMHINKPVIILPDGSRHPLRVTGYMDPDGFMELFPDGSYGCGGTGGVDFGGTVTSYTTDGTFLRLAVQQDSDNDFSNNAWTLFMPNGSRVEHYSPATAPATGVTQRTYDRNGNYIEIVEKASDSAYNNHKTTYIQDALGRKVVVEYDAATNQDWIHSKGYNNADLKTKVQWKNITVNKTYNGCNLSPSAPNCDAKTLTKTFKVADKIYLPAQVGNPAQADDFFYEFDYNPGTGNPSNGWGEVSEVTLPSGATSSYEYALDGANNEKTEAILRNRPDKKTLEYAVQYDGASPTTVTDVWTYGVTYHPFPSDPYITATASITAPDGSVSTEHYALGTASPYAYTDGELWKSVGADGSTVEKYYQSSVPREPTDLYAANRFVRYEYVSIADASGNLTKTAIKAYSQDKNGNTTEVKEYDFVSYSSVPRDTDGKPNGLPSNINNYLKRKTVTDYYNDTPAYDSSTYTDADSYHLASSPRLLNLAKSSETGDGTNPKSRSEIVYDYTSYTSNTKGGNATETKVWDSYKGGTARAYSNPLTSTNSVSTTATYDAYGNPLTTTDANAVTTTFTYGCIDGQTSCAASLQNLYPTKTEAASNYSGLKRTSTAEYDFSTGLVKKATDVDNSVSSETVYDDLGRATKAMAAVGTTSEVWTQTEYDDAARRVVVKSDVAAKGDAQKVAAQFYDQLGRVRLSKTLEDAATQSATNETDGIKVQTRYRTGGACTYDANKTCSFQLVSNPYRANYSYNAGAEPSMGWTRSQTINNGRHSETETFSGAALPQPFLTSGYNTVSTGAVKTDTDAVRALVTDQAGKQRISETNAFGQLTDVWEIMPSSDAATVSVTFPNQTGVAYGYKTSYQYDTLNNLTTVNQPIGTSGGQTRTFSYSSLSRLLTATNPESGTINYQYDNNGNLTKKTDARSIETNYTYDALNRVTVRDYSDSTPDVTYTYDNVTHAKGKLTKVYSDVSETKYTSFDIMGRVTASEQRTPFDTETVANATLRASGYVYNLSGALVEQTYPSTRVVKNILDNEGDLSVVKSRKNATSAYWDYAQNFTYTAAGAVSSMQLGNGRWESTVFNARLQPTQIALGTLANGTDKLKLNFDYGTTANNGNVLSQTITVPSETRGSTTYSAFVATQTYTYDSLNRIKDAVEMIGTTEQWKQTFSYDRFGNRSFNEGSASGNYLTTTLTRNCSTSSYNPNGICDKKSANPTFAASNKIVQDQDSDSVNDYLFDSAGNTTKAASGSTFIYDAENKQTEVKNSSNQTIGQYWYDGDGKRVKKYVPATGETTIFVYDASGKMAAEYSTIVATQTDAKVSYLTSDHLGSPRINTDKYGEVASRHDYRPFGEEITRASYGADDVRKKFGTYERDNETDLDFAQARMYNKNLGRFNSTDPILISKGHPANPQRWNLFIYVVNNPLTLNDPDGKKPKRVIDVFISIGDGTIPKEWLQLRGQAKKQGVKINIYTGKTATTEQFTKSLSTPGRSVVFYGHASTDPVSYEKHLSKGASIKGKGVGLGFYNGVVGGGEASTPISGVDTKAKEAIVFSCDFTKLRDDWKSSSGTQLLYIDAGNNGTISEAAGTEAAFKAVNGLMNGNSLSNIKREVQTVINNHQNDVDERGDKLNVGDGAKLVNLPNIEEN